MRYVHKFITGIFTSCEFYSYLTYLLFAWFLYTAMTDTVAYGETDILKLLLPFIQVATIILTASAAVRIYAAEHSRLKQKQIFADNSSRYPRQFQDTIEFNWVHEDTNIYK